MFTFDPICNFTTATLQATSIIYFATYYILLPYYLTVGLFLNCLLLIALYRRSKSKSSIAYQLFVEGAKTYEIVNFGLYAACSYWWTSAGGYAAPWFVSNYALMWFLYRILYFTSFMGYVLPPFFSVATAADRVFSLWSPLRYRSKNHRAHKSIAFVLCVTFPILLTQDIFWIWGLVEISNPNGTTTTTKVYAGSKSTSSSLVSWSQISATLRMTIRLTLVLCLAVLNYLMLYLYRRRMRRLDAMTSAASEERLRARKEINKDLLILCVCQSILTCTGQMPQAVMDMLRRVSPYWSACGLVTAAEYNAATMLSTCAEFYLLVIVDRRVRSCVPGYTWFKKVCAKFKSHVAPDGSPG